MSMVDDAEQLSDLIGAIYDAALEPRLWTDAVARASRFVAGDAGALRQSALAEEPGTSLASALAVHRAVDDESRRRIGLLGEHVRRSLHIGNVLKLSKVDAAAFADAMDALAASVYLVDADGRLVHANAAGQAMLRDADVVRAANGKLTLIDQAGNQSLQQAIVAAHANGGAVDPRGVAVPTFASGGQRLVAHVLPLQSGARRAAGRDYSAVAAVFIRKEVLELPSSIEVFARAFALTPAESRVLLASLQVAAVSDIAALLGIAAPTIKTHLRRVYAKTGTTRQAELIRRVAGYMSPLAG